MKKSIIAAIFLLHLSLDPFISVYANDHKPARPERIQEDTGERPSEYHTWLSGRWKWNRRSETWEWSSGYWKFDHDLYLMRNRWRYNGFYRPFYSRYLAIPLGRGYYRLVAY